jgi:hypothetical protein
MSEESREEAIEANAEGPKRVKGDQGEVEQHSIRDQIEADRYLASKAATTGARRGLKFNRLIPPGACS